MKVTFSNNDYVCSHGRNPRGTGSWAFHVHCFHQYGIDKMPEIVFAPSLLTLVKARQWVKKQLSELLPSFIPTNTPSPIVLSEVMIETLG